jgi:hypothetical protein
VTVRIVILDKGFVSVGVYSQGTDWASLDNAFIVRRWGTSKGLGEIAEHGPTDSTILDKTPKQNFPVRSIINTIDCNAKKWKKVLGL